MTWEGVDMKKSLAIFAVISLVATGALADVGRPRQLGTLGGNNSNARAINNSGQIAGDADTADGAVHAFLFERGHMRDLGTLGGDLAFGQGINDRGQVVGVSIIPSGEAHAFLWENGRMVDLGVPPGRSFSEARAINNRGTIVGESEGTAVVWDAGRIQVLDAPGTDSSIAAAINNGGVVAGWVGFPDFSTMAVIWQHGQMVELG